MKITVPKEWYAQSAKIEGDSEVGAGIPSFLRESAKIDASDCEIKNILCQTETKHRPRKAPNEFVEAVLIAQFTREMSTSEYPLGHLRQNKLVYFAHRKADEDVAEWFSKLAAGPYSSRATYKGPEGIAQRNGYVRRAKVGSRTGFLVGEKIGDIDQYVSRYPACAAAAWVVSNFRYKKNEELELFATVDFAALDLIQQHKPVTVENVKHIINTTKEWAAKLQRDIFSDSKIAEALAELRSLFPSTYE